MSNNDCAPEIVAIPSAHQPRILVCEDERDIADIVKTYLESQGMQVVVERDGGQVTARFRQYRPDLVLLDINMPNRDGFENLAALRAASNVPIVFLTARTDDLDQLQGLESGGDDYILKPFNPNHVVARVKAVLRRSRGDAPLEHYRWRRLGIDVVAWRAWFEADSGEIRLDLTPAELRILAYLLQNPGRVISRATLMDSCFPDSDALERTIDSHVSHIRRKLRLAGAPDTVIGVVRGVGFRLE
ncbi:MAG: response regulator transcription factor [Pseudomonadota bacterium]